MSRLNILTQLWLQWFNYQLRCTYKLCEGQSSFIPKFLYFIMVFSEETAHIFHILCEDIFQFLKKELFTRSGINGPVRIGPRFLKFWWSWFGPRFLNFVGPGPLGPGSTVFGPWIPALDQSFCFLELAVEKSSLFSLQLINYIEIILIRKSFYRYP